MIRCRLSFPVLVGLENRWVALLGQLVMFPGIPCLLRGLRFLIHWARLPPENSLVTSKPKEPGHGVLWETSPSFAVSSLVKFPHDLESECDPDSDPLDIALCSWDQTGVDIGLDLHLNADSQGVILKTREFDGYLSRFPTLVFPRSRLLPRYGAAMYSAAGLV
ncbi:hypothetical protein Nepgr_021426 [Nepenthes gracilis]|uniref:Uncharacterized protein n=1 Tax=Nepenthes gracilis TaxID=150966 RepID=A0AAD3SYL4_NEPGR|nr:hypothetical protein Nepgr_021426 [Nepenthes gracilis]